MKRLVAVGVSADVAARCPLCADIMAEPEVRNSLSRFADSYICNTCGLAEALLRRIKDNEPRQCLYYDGTFSGLMLVTEDEPGYYPYAAAPLGRVDEDWITRYIESVHAQLGITDDAALDIVASSMFGSRRLR
ncbi:hypothetical protein E3G67_003569 [Mycobacteroides abscessus]|nr:hypothetical protein [Mycobacteroides abscessus]